MDSLGIYISVPFCRSKCTYCNFASGVYSTELQTRYVDRLRSQILNARSLAATWGVDLPLRADSVYWGGGTPSILSPEQLRAIWDALRREFDIPRTAEVTLECAPGQLNDATLDAALENGLNRISFGVQSFVDREAAATGRLHTRQTALTDIARVRMAGVPEVNVDLIAGLPHQTSASWQESLDTLTETGVGHASIYMLEVDEDSRLGREVLNRGTRYHAGAIPSEELTVEFYETASGVLEGLGLRRYEISNFAREGSESRHNRRYWLREPYFGFGLDAHSMLRREDGTALRFNTGDDLEQYIGGVGLISPTALFGAKSCAGPRTGPVAPTPREVFATEELEEAWFLGLRMLQGVSWDRLVEQFGSKDVEIYRHAVEELRELNLVREQDGFVRLTPKGILISNDVFSRFIEISQAG